MRRRAAHRRNTPVSALEALRSGRYANPQPTAAARRAQFRRAARSMLTVGACIAAVLLVVVPLLSLEADALGGGGGGRGAAGAVTLQESADTAADLADTAALLSAAEVLTPSTSRISVGRVVSVGHEPVAPGWQLVRLAAAVSSDVP